jgi:hypothetical protein
MIQNKTIAVGRSGQKCLCACGDFSEVLVQVLKGAKLLGDWVWSAPNSVHLEHPVCIYLLGHTPQHGVHGHVCGGGWANHRPGLNLNLVTDGPRQPLSDPDSPAHGNLRRWGDCGAF